MGKLSLGYLKLGISLHRKIELRISEAWDQVSKEN